KTKKLAEQCSYGNTDHLNKIWDTMQLVYWLIKIPGWNQVFSWENQIRGYVDELCNYVMNDKVVNIVYDEVVNVVNDNVVNVVKDDVLHQM
ncbi:hypothetical protein SNEBB_000006, partial [Seison nebaliae]